MLSPPLSARPATVMLAALLTILAPAARAAESNSRTSSSSSAVKGSLIGLVLSTAIGRAERHLLRRC